MSVISSCTVLKPPAPKPPPSKPEAPIEPKPEKEEPKKEVELSVNKITLLLPLQLDDINANSPTRNDVKRAEMPLDFYQGIKIALDKLAREGNNFQLNVVDTRDNVSRTAFVAKEPDIQAADLIVGPIFPKEIGAFANAAKLGNSLQVSPLAASAPSTFNINNLVTLASPINQHADGLARYLNRNIKNNDRLIVYSTTDVEEGKFVSPLQNHIKEISKGRIEVIKITNIDDLEDALTIVGKNYFITASQNKFAIDALMVQLVELKNSYGYEIQLVGHPNWIKSSFQQDNLKALDAIITTSYYIDSQSTNVRDFQRLYMKEFKVEPTEFAYKGFDTGYFFGSLLAKYGPKYPEYLSRETYKGLQTSYTFEYNSKWGYVNTFIQVLQFDGYEYRPIH